MDLLNKIKLLPALKIYYLDNFYVEAVIITAARGKGKDLVTNNCSGAVRSSLFYVIEVNLYLDIFVIVASDYLILKEDRRFSKIAEENHGLCFLGMPWFHSMAIIYIILAISVIAIEDRVVVLGLDLISVKVELYAP
jgi:hypothetical protein